MCISPAALVLTVYIESRYVNNAENSQFLSHLLLKKNVYMQPNLFLPHTHASYIYIDKYTRPIQSLIAWSFHRFFYFVRLNSNRLKSSHIKL